VIEHCQVCERGCGVPAQVFIIGICMHSSTPPTHHRTSKKWGTYVPNHRLPICRTLWGHRPPDPPGTRIRMLVSPQFRYSRNAFKIQMGCGIIIIIIIIIECVPGLPGPARFQK
jgi:hypothetical protein